MGDLSIFKDMAINEINEVMNSLGARKIIFKKDHIIVSNLVDDDLIGIIMNGKASIVIYDYFGNRDIIDTLEYDDVFGKSISYINSDVYVIAATDCEVLFLDYHELINNIAKYDKINYNLNRLLNNKVNRLYEKIELLSKRSIRDKLLCYFNNMAKTRRKKTFNLPITYIELADYLSVDRSAMMRELKKLKDEKIIFSDGKKITLYY